MSIYHFGRSDLEYPTAKTRVGVELSGLGAWQHGDSLQLVSPNVGLAIAGLETHFAYPRVGSTTISGQALDWKNAFSPIIDVQKGDTTWIAQMSHMPAGAGSYYSVLTRSGVAGGFSLRDGQPSRLSATLAPVVQDRELTFHWRGSEFAALATQAGPGARPAPAPTLSIKALPDPIARNNSYFNNLYLYLPSLVDFGPVSGSADFHQHIKYGNPFASNGARWTELVTMVYAVPVLVPGVGRLHAMMISATPVGEIAGGGVLAPAISPVRNVRIDGQLLDGPRTGVGASPTITWDAPEIGTSTGYRVSVQAIERVGKGVRLTDAGTFHTRTTSLELPAFVGQSASSYVLIITAISATGRDLASRPFIGSLPYASADHVTARITP